MRAEDGPTDPSEDAPAAGGGGPGEEAPPRAEHRGRVPLALRLLVWVLFLGAAGVYAQQRLEARDLARQENEAIELYNRDQYQRALRKFLELYPELDEEGKQRLNKPIARCYTKQADAVASLDEKERLFRKALEYDPDCVIHISMRDRIKRSGGVESED